MCSPADLDCEGPVVGPKFGPYFGGYGGGGGSDGGESCDQYIQEWLQTCDLKTSGCPEQLCGSCPDNIDASIRSCCTAEEPDSCFQSALGGSNNQAASITSAAPDPNFTSCVTVFSLYSSCETAISGFDSMDNKQQASCVCYDGNGAAAASVFDGAWSACASWAQTSDTTDFAVFSTGLGFCARALGSSPASATAFVGTPSGTAVATTGVIGGSGMPASTGTSATPTKGLGIALVVNPMLTVSSLILTLCVIGVTSL